MSQVQFFKAINPTLASPDRSILADCCIDGCNNKIRPGDKYIVAKIVRYEPIPYHGTERYCRRHIIEVSPKAGIPSAETLVRRGEAEELRHAAQFCEDMNIDPAAPPAGG